MPQNLSDRERKQRLGASIVTFISAIGVFYIEGFSILFVGLILGATGFMINYFTCFCGLKRMFQRLKNRLTT